MFQFNYTIHINNPKNNPIIQEPKNIDSYFYSKNISPNGKKTLKYYVRNKSQMETASRKPKFPSILNKDNNGQFIGVENSFSRIPPSATSAINKLTKSYESVYKRKTAKIVLKKNEVSSESNFNTIA